ncbi:MAG: hypothetical protein QHH10_03555 [Peptococcaceae bacterium]|nr:hypothetical protein [Peptococcaceae bacterium]MDH7524374.1 hypothetical protein [Peptococcaceae bacterium]
MGGGRDPVRLGIRYCGGCNPGIDREEITKKILRLLVQAGMKLQVVYEGDERSPDFWLTVSGCESDCTSRKDSLAEVVVAGCSVDRWKAAGEEDIVLRAYRKIIELAGKKRTGG